MAFISRASVKISLLSEHIRIVSQQLGRFHWFHWSPAAGTDAANTFTDDAEAELPFKT